ncbi:hypothetical protein EV128_101164 [Rhizobium azibense]|nr:hypothetical protein EV128_101164 [Rhizobium azibense]
MATEPGDHLAYVVCCWSLGLAGSNYFRCGAPWRQGCGRLPVHRHGRLSFRGALGRSRIECFPDCPRACTKVVHAHVLAAHANSSVSIALTVSSSLHAPTGIDRCGHHVSDQFPVIHFPPGSLIPAARKPIENSLWQLSVYALPWHILLEQSARNAAFARGAGHLTGQSGPLHRRFSWIDWT